MSPVICLSSADERVGDGGSTLGELALVLPIFLMTLIGLFAFVVVLAGYGNASYACRKGARYASLHGAGSQAPAITATVQAVIASSLWLLLPTE